MDKAIQERARLVSKGSEFVSLQASAFLGGNGSLVVNLKHCTNLPRMDLGSLTDSFCILQLGEETCVSKVIKNTVDPVFEETFVFPVTNCAGQTLHLRFMDFDDMPEEELEIAHKTFVNEGKRKAFDPSEESPTLTNCTNIRAASATSCKSLASEADDAPFFDPDSSIHDCIGFTEVPLRELLGANGYALEKHRFITDAKSRPVLGYSGGTQAHLHSTSLSQLSDDMYSQVFLSLSFKARAMESSDSARSGASGLLWNLLLLDENLYHVRPRALNPKP
jgi:hypothetical protein